MSLEREKSVKGTIPPTEELRNLNKKIKLFSPFVEAKLEYHMATYGIKEADGVEPMRASRMKIAEDMNAEISACESIKPPYSPYMWANALGFAADNREKYHKGIILDTIAEVAYLDRDLKSNVKVQALDLDHEEGMIVYGIPLSIEYLYGNAFNPTNPEWWRIRSDMLPAYKAVQQGLFRYLDPDYMSYANRGFIGFTDIFKAKKGNTN